MADEAGDGGFTDANELSYLEDIVGQRREIDDLIAYAKLIDSKHSSEQHASSGTSAGSLSSGSDSRSSSETILPADIDVKIVNLRAFRRDITKLEYMIELHKTIAASMPDSDEQHIHEVLIRLDKIKYPTVFPKCPLLEDVQQNILKENLFVTVYSLDGYNFSSEFNHVYRGKTTWITAYADILVIITRAVQAHDPSISSYLCSQYAEYLMRMVGWETEICHITSSQTLEDSFPVLNAEVEHSASFHHAKIYIGRSPDGPSLCAWLRITPGIMMTADLGMEDNASIEIARSMKFVYCRRLHLTRESIKNFLADVASAEAAAKNNEAPDGRPPEPPKIPQKSDLTMCIHVEQLRVHSGDRRTREEQAQDATLASQNDEDFDDRNQGLGVGVLDGRTSVAPSSASVASITSGRSGDASSLGIHSEGMATAQNEGKESSDFEYDDATVDPAVERKAAATEGASHCTELIGWGHNAGYCMGLDKNEIYEPRPIPIPASLSLEKIGMISCSPRHTVILTMLGNLFSCGENTEGALGLNDVISRSAFTLIPWNPSPASDGSEARVVKVATGSGPIGSHTLALDSTGRVYAWGCSHSLGLGHIRPVHTPTIMDSFPNPDGSFVMPEDDDGDFDGMPPVRDIACGGGFSAVVLRSGKVATWGMWTHGRLGLGPIPAVEKRGKVKKARYQLRPRYINGIETAKEVACGDSHALCVTYDGYLLSWGQNSCGQLGTGVMPSGFLRDTFTPIVIPPFAPENPLGDYAVDPRLAASTATPGGGIGSKRVVVSKISCGSYHSIAIDTLGRCFTWGARGSDCLGHYDCQISGEWSKRLGSVFTAATNLTKVMVPFELRDWCNTWAKPRLIESLVDIKIESASGGDMHTCILTNTGRLMLCGIGPVVPHFVGGGEEGGGRDRAFKSRDKDAEEEGAVMPAVVSIMRSPSAVWLPAASHRRVNLVSSSGTRCFVVHDTEIIADNMRLILKRTIHGSRSSEKDEVGTEDGSLDTHLYSESSRGNILEQRGKVDAMVLASGKVLLAHRALLSHRSNVLRDMLIEESPADEAGGEPTQILLPELHADVARALMYFLYTDVLPLFATSNVSILRSLVRVGKSLRIPRLEIVSQRILHVLTVAERTHKGHPNPTAIHEFGLELPPVTLTRDLGSMVGDPQYADVRFFAEGKTVYAHRFILEARCAYFRAMFRTGMAETQDSTGVFDVIVPDSFIGFLRFIIFIYTSTLPDGSDGALLEDLMSADRYGMTDMIRTCESMLCPSSSNWLDILRASHLIGSTRLQLEVEGYIRDNLHELSNPFDFAVDSQSMATETDDASITSLSHTSTAGGENPVFAAVKEEFPDLIQRIMTLRTQAHPMPPSELLMSQTMAGTEGEKEKETQPVAFNFPWQVLSIGFTGWAVFHIVGQNVHLGFLLPFINIIGVVLIIYYGFTIKD